MHLIPEVLAGQPRDIDRRERIDRRGRRPRRDSAFAGRVTRPADGGERQRLPHGQPIVLRGTGADGRVRIDQRRELQRLRELPHRRTPAPCVCDATATCSA